MVDTLTLIATYKRSQDQLIKAILSSKSVAFNTAMLQTVNKELARLQGHTVKWVEKNIPAAYVEGMAAVNKSHATQLAAAGKEAFKSYPTQFSVLNRKAIGVLVENTKADFTNAIGFVGRKVKDDIRQASLEAIADKVSTGTTIEKTRKILAQKYADQGLAAIKYQRKGKDVFMSLDAYAGTVARSTAAEATNTGTKNQVEELGEDLVQMTQHSSSCPVCSVLEGRVYSISGKNKNYPPLDKAYTDGYANIHPNCGHRLVPYIAELKTEDQLEADRAFSARSFDSDKWKKADREKLEANLKSYKAGQAKKRALYTDRQQWERYKAAVGPDNAPKSLSGFRSMKKADGDNWKELQSKYRASLSSARKEALLKKAEEEAKRKALEDKIARRKAQIKAAAERRKAEAAAKKAADEAAKKAAIELAKKKAEEEAKIARRKAQIKAAADRRKAALAAKKAPVVPAKPAPVVKPAPVAVKVPDTPAVMSFSGLEKTLGKPFVKGLKDRVAESKIPDDFARVWNKYIPAMKYAEVDYVPPLGKASAFYNPNTRRITLNRTKVQAGGYSKQPFGTMFHETGHLIDFYQNGNTLETFSVTWNKGAFGKAAAEDYAELLADARAALRVNRLPTTEEAVIRNIRSRFVLVKDKAKLDVSDMLEGRSAGKITLNGGHGAEYWKTMPPEIEMFAEMFDATINNPLSLKVIQQEFPRAYDVFLQMIHELALP